MLSRVELVEIMIRDLLIIRSALQQQMVAAPQLAGISILEFRLRYMPAHLDMLSHPPTMLEGSDLVHFLWSKAFHFVTVEEPFGVKALIL